MIAFSQLGFMMIQTLILLCLVHSGVRAVQFPNLVQNVENRLYSGELIVYPDGTLLVHVGSTYRISDLILDPIVRVADTGLGFQTHVIARVHPNSTVIWSAAVTTLDNMVSTAIDEDGNAYLGGSGPGQNPVRIVKFSPDGTLLFSRRAPGLGKQVFLVSGLGSVLAYRPKPRHLLIPVEEYSRTGATRISLLAFGSGEGRFRRAFKMPWIRQSANWGDFVADDNVACVVMLRFRSEGVVETAGIVVQCIDLMNAKVTETVFEKPKSYVFNVKLALGKGTDGNSILWLAAERATGLSSDTASGSSKAKHTLLVLRLNAKTLKEVDNHTGGIEVTLPPSYGQDGAIMILKTYVERNSFSLLLGAFVKFEKFVKVTSRTYRVEGRSSRKFTLYKAPEFWFLQFGDDGLAVRKLEQAPKGRPGGERFKNMWVGDLTPSPNGKKAYVYGYLDKFNKMKSGPLYFYTVPRPVKVAKTLGKFRKRS